MSERGLTYHHQDDVTGFCADYRHPHGCQDDTTPHTQENMTMDATGLTPQSRNKDLGRPQIG